MPVLTILNNQDPYVVYMDASSTWLGGVLMQNGRVVAYHSQKLKPNEKNYLTNDLELTLSFLKKKFMLKIWSYYLYDVNFDTYSDHKNLKYVFTQQDLNFQQHW